MDSSARQTRIAQLRSQIEQLQQELARLEKEAGQEQGPYGEYLERVRAAGQQPLSAADFQRYSGALAQMELEWQRLGKPAEGFPRYPVMVRLRALLQLPALEQPAAPTRPAAGAAGSTKTAPVTAAAPTSSNSRAPAAQVKHISLEQLIEMHNPILNEVVELTKRASEEFRGARVPDGLISTERAMYLMERVAHAPPAMPNQINKVVVEAMRAPGVQEADRQRLLFVQERATKLAAQSSQH